MITKDDFEDLRDAITSVHFSYGGFFGEHQDIRFEKRRDVITLSVVSFPSSDEAYNEVITEKEWKKLLDKLFCKLCVHEWRKRYVDLGVLDGEQWGLQFKLTGGRQRNYYGSNAYPPLWKELKNVFRPYFKRYGIDINSNNDLFAVFIEKCGELLKPTGYQAMITQHAWMFLSSLEKLRNKLLKRDIVNMAHLGARAFEEIGGDVAGIWRKPFE